MIQHGTRINYEYMEIYQSSSQSVRYPALFTDLGANISSVSIDMCPKVSFYILIQNNTTFLETGEFGCKLDVVIERK